MDILELCKGMYASEIDSIATDVEGNIEEVNSFADSIEKHDGVKYTTPRKQNEDCRVYWKESTFQFVHPNGHPDKNLSIGGFMLPWERV